MAANDKDGSTIRLHIGNHVVKLERKVEAAVVPTLRLW